MISPDRLHKAMTYLAETDKGFAIAKSYMIGLDDQKKTILATQYVNAEGSQGDKNQIALASGEYKVHLKKYKDSVYDYEILRNKRITESLIVEVWRSLNAARNKGNIV